MILDAAAGNRTMWRTKHSEHIIYIDIEKRLERKPTIFADNTNTPFLNEAFSTIFYDPPHGWGKGHYFYNIPDSETFKKKWRGYGQYPRYYGWDKCKTRGALIAHLYKAQTEFYRILQADGLLWLKWNEAKLPLSRILRVFDRWQELMRLYITSPTQTAGAHQTYWVCLQKKEGKEKQIRLM